MLIRYRGHLYRAMPYRTRDPIPGTAEKKFRAAVARLRQPSTGLRFIARGIVANQDDDSGDGRNYVQDLEDLEKSLAKSAMKGDEIIQYGMDGPEDRNAYELLRSMKWLVEMLGYWQTNELELLQHRVQQTKQSLDDFLYRYLGADVSNPIDSIYDSAGNDVEEYFGGMDVWEQLKSAYQELQELTTVIAVIEDFAQYSKSGYEYAVRWQQERSRKSPEKIFPEGVGETEVMWHVTTAYSKVLREGLKSKQQLQEPAGLGGGDDERISFTASFALAEGIRDAMLDMARLMRGPTTLEAVDQFRQEIGVSDEGWEWIQRVYQNNWGTDVGRHFGHLVEYVLTRAQEEGLRYNPVFFGADIRDRFARLDPAEIDIVEATVIITDETTYHRAEEEWRVAPDDIVSLGPVGSQTSGSE